MSERRPDARRRLLVATRSVHKLRELRELLDLQRTDLVSLDDLGVPGDPAETGDTFETNAAIKARFGVRATGLPTLADDSGLEVDALDGGPGVRTRRYAGEQATDPQNNARLLEARVVSGFADDYLLWATARAAGSPARDTRDEAAANQAISTS